jgi:hypothetical protein
MKKEKQTKFEGKIEPYHDSTPFYMVFVEDSVHPPKIKHEKYEDAFNEMLRLSKHENKKAYIMISVTQVEQIPNIKLFNLP